jgi:hypothetical protein
MSERRDDRGRRRSGAGNALIVVLIVVTVLLAGVATSLTYAGSISTRVHGAMALERSSAIGDGGLAWVVEQWRRTPAFLDFVDLNGDGVATLPTENPQLGLSRPLGRGTFELTEIRDTPIGGTVPAKVVTLRAEYAGARYTWRALLAPNVLVPILGVGTQASQFWSGGSTFDAIYEGRGCIFANGDLTVRGQSTITGDCVIHGQVITQAGGAIDGTIEEGAPLVEFPDQQARVGAAVEAARTAPLGSWSDARNSLVIESPVAAMESLDADATTFGSAWPAIPSMSHLMIRGGAVRLPAGSYAFGRLWLDGAILTITAPSDGGRLILPDIYLTNGARLVIDARDGAFTAVAPENNSFFLGSDVGNQNGRRWSGSAWQAGAPSIRLDGGAAAYTWSNTAGQAGYTGPKPARGTTPGYDDWIIRDESAFVVVTSSPASKGFQLYMQEGLDLVLHNGARLIGGIQPADYDAVRSSATTVEGLDALGANAMGFLAWSAGGYLPRLNINAWGANPGNASRFFGLTYGGFEATIGPQGDFTGAFVGTSMECRGEVHFDARLTMLVVEPDPGSEHVVAKWRLAP